MNETVFEIPYCLDTLEAVREAMQVDFLGLGNGYDSMMSAARRFALEKPDALIKARRMVEREFYTIDADTIRTTKTTAEELASLQLFGQFPLIERSIPWVKEIASQDDLLAVLTKQYAGHVKVVSPSGKESFPVQRGFETILTIRRLLKRDLLHCAKTGKPMHLTRDELKKALVTYVLLDPKQDDVLQAVRSSVDDERDDNYKNAVAELLFQRIPLLVKELTMLPPLTIRKKLFNKLAGLHLPSNQRIQLHGYFPPLANRDELLPILKKLGTIVDKTAMPREIRAKLGDYLKSLRQNIERGMKIYRELFLNQDLEVMKKIYKPVPFTRTAIHYEKRMMMEMMNQNKLVLYPTKDYLDLWKGKFSHDCIGAYNGEKQLRIKNHFNIRIFQADQWIGNIYMLDLTHEYRVLLIDRIQISRDLKIYYHNFFGNLKEMLANLFEDVLYNEALVPLAISNNMGIQKLYNAHRKTLQPRRVQIKVPYADLFESIRGRNSYWVLYEKGSSLQIRKE
ncbi:MAG: hypothetical protein AB2L22_12820 [Syntrophales bacterium]